MQDGAFLNYDIAAKGQKVRTLYLHTFFKLSTGEHPLAFPLLLALLQYPPEFMNIESYRLQHVQTFKMRASILITWYVFFE